jgi:Tol biopolymer transport system component
MQSWSPDSNEILIKCLYGCGPEYSSFARVDVEQKEFVGWLSASTAGTVAWSPVDKNTLATTHYRSLEGLFLIDQNGENLREILGENDLARWNHYLYGGSWSPDGRRMVLYLPEENNFNWELFMVDLEVEQPQLRRLTETPRRELVPVWSPGGTEIAFISVTQAGEWDVNVLDTATLTVEQLTHSPNIRESALTWSPNGIWLAYKSTTILQSQNGVFNETESEILLLNRQTGEIHTFIADGELLLTLDWSPDGQWIAATKEHVAQSIDGDSRSIVLFDVADFLDELETAD